MKENKLALRITLCKQKAVMNPHTPPALPRRMRLIGKLPCPMFLIALCTLLAIPPVAAQNNGHGRAQAVLHVQAQVVPVTYEASARTATSPTNDASDVIYSLSARQATMTVVEEIRMVSRAEIAAWHQSRTVQDAILKTVTIVPQ